MIGLPVVFLVTGMSVLGHKVSTVWFFSATSDVSQEWRFIIYVVPWINALAAIVCGQM